MTYTCFDVETSNHVAHVRMIRPERANSMIPEFWQELPEIVDQLSAGGDARVIVLSAEGRHFCSGMDLSVFAGNNNVSSQEHSKHGSRQRAALRSGVLELQRTFSCLEESRLPVLSAIQGACIGGGIDMVSATDLRYATEDAFFCIQEINIGMTADVGTLQRMPKLVPEKKAKKKLKPKVASAPATPKPSASPVPKVTEVSEALPPLPPKAAPKLAEPKAAEAPPAVTEQSAVPAAAEIRPGRAIRVEFGAAESKLPPAAKDALTSLATAIKNDEHLRLQLMAYAGGNELSASKARRLSLSRALSVRSFLIEKGVRSTRVDVRALGNKTADKPINRVDVNVAER